MTGPHWMPIAWREFGVRERPGTADEPRVVDYHQATTLKATDDEVPWCSAFACWIMRAAHVPNPRSAAARLWLPWGQSITERYGAVAVLARGTNPAQGHVGFLLDSDEASVWLLGGNQDDCVSVARFDRARVLGFRWPIE
jgi:uncharacterized protein (TIGR02594 family)